MIILFSLSSLITRKVQVPRCQFKECGNHPRTLKFITEERFFIFTKTKTARSLHSYEVGKGINKDEFDKVLTQKIEIVVPHTSSYKLATSCFRKEMG